MSNKLFRFAELIAKKYELISEADIVVPSQEVVLNKQKQKLQELYNNFFSVDADLATSKTIPMHALFELRDIEEPYVSAMFKIMNELMESIDTLSLIQIFRRVNKLLLLCGEATPNKIQEHLEKFRTENRKVLRDKQQFVIGFKNRIKSITRRLEEVRNMLMSLVPESELQKPMGKMVEYPASIIQEGLIRRFLVSPAADKYKLTKDNWDMMFSDPKFSLRLARLLHSWEKNNYVWVPALANELKLIVSEFEHRKESNLPYLEEGETFAPSTSTSIPPENINIFDPKTGPAEENIQFGRFRLAPEYKEFEKKFEDEGGFGEGSL